MSNINEQSEKNETSFIKFNFSNSIILNQLKKNINDKNQTTIIINNEKNNESYKENSIRTLNSISLKLENKTNNENSVSLSDKIEHLINKADILIKRYKTPYYPSEINDEVYPDESFRIKYEKKSNFNSNKIEFKNSLVDKNIDFFLNCGSSKQIFINEKLSICSCENLEINSKYENIAKLSEFKYVRDINFQSKIIDYILQETKLRKSRVSCSGLSKSLSIRKHNSPKQRTTNKMNSSQKIQNVKKFNFTMIGKKNIGEIISQIKLDNEDAGALSSPRDKKRIRTSVTKQNTHSNNINILTPTKKPKLKPKTKNKMLNEISKTIIENSNALNNPDEFYNGLFANIIINSVKSPTKTYKSKEGIMKKYTEKKGSTKKKKVCFG